MTITHSTPRETLRHLVRSLFRDLPAPYLDDVRIAALGDDHWSLSSTVATPLAAAGEVVGLVSRTTDGFEVSFIDAEPEAHQFDDITTAVEFFAEYVFALRLGWSDPSLV